MTRQSLSRFLSERSELRIFMTIKPEKRGAEPSGADFACQPGIESHDINLSRPANAGHPAGTNATPMQELKHSSGLSGVIRRHLGGPHWRGVARKIRHALLPLALGALATACAAAATSKQPFILASYTSKPAPAA